MCHRFLLLYNWITAKVSPITDHRSCSIKSLCFPKLVKASILIGFWQGDIFREHRLTLRRTGLQFQMKRKDTLSGLWRHCSTIFTIITYDICLPLCLDLPWYAEHILASMHTVEAAPSTASAPPSLRSMFCHSPFPIHSAVLSGFRYSLGRAARLATRDAEATAAHPLNTHRL